VLLAAGDGHHLKARGRGWGPGGAGERW
jgi:hypothetical protein